MFFSAPVLGDFLSVAIVADRLRGEDGTDGDCPPLTVSLRVRAFCLGDGNKTGDDSLRKGIVR